MSKHIKSTKNFNALIAQLEASVDAPAGGLGFDMTTVFTDRDQSPHPCGSACCIGGHAQAILLSRGVFDTETMPGVATALRELVGIPEYEDAWRICYPTGPAVVAGAWLAEPRHAVALLKHYDETGEVDWVKAMQVSA